MAERLSASVRGRILEGTKTGAKCSAGQEKDSPRQHYAPALVIHRLDGKVTPGSEDEAQNQADV